ENPPDIPPAEEVLQLLDTIVLVRKSRRLFPERLVGRAALPANQVSQRQVSPLTLNVANERSRRYASPSI
ncbi:hypothetical protein LSAT2_011349, partial [Lamellibrachia satsuma]